MGRLARVIMPGIPHHIIQRGNRRQRTFFRNADYRKYLEVMKKSCERTGIHIWSYCLMPNHIHLIAVPFDGESLMRGIGEAHRRYTCYIHSLKDWKGYLWQGRFASYPLDRKHLALAVRYVELNPVRAGMVHEPDAYEWSSARAHIEGVDDALVKVKPMLRLVSDWREYLARGMTEIDAEMFRKHERTGRPLGDDSFIGRLEDKLGRTLRKKRPGPQ